MALTYPPSLGIEGSNILIFPREGELGQCVGAIVDNIPLMRSEDIDTAAKCTEFLKQAKLLQGKLVNVTHKRMRIASLHLNNLREEWSYIRDQHRFLIQANQKFGEVLKVAHLSLPTERIYYKISPRFLSPLLKHDLMQLLNQFNTEGCCIYCSWICEEIEEILKTFQPTAGEEYALQARLQDFCHEVHSGILTSHLQEINESIIKQGSTDKADTDAIFALEKVIMSERRQLLPLLQYQLVLLKQIIDAIEKIEKERMELLKLKNIATISYLLLGNQFEISGLPKASWGKRVLLLQLLDQYLGVISCMNSHDGIGRTNYVFTIRLALAAMMNKFPEKDILNLCLNWDEQFEGKLGRELRRRVWKNFEAMHIPLRTLLVREGDLNLIFLHFLPREVTVQNKQIPMLIYDADNKFPIDLTEEGKTLLKV